MPIRALSILLVCSSGAVFGAETGGAPAPADTGAGTEYAGVAITRTAAATSDLPASVAIDETAVIGPASPLLFGVNQAWLPQERLMTGGPDGGPQAGLDQLTRGLPLPLNRMAGTDSGRFRWKQAIGPITGRTAFPDEFGRSAVRAYGPVEWIGSIRRIDPSARFSWTFNCLEEEPADHADLAEFLTGTPGVNANGGEDWAAKRVACGIAEPVPVAIWEIGNEVDHSAGLKKRFPDPATYADYAARTIKAVRAVQPAARFAVHAATAPWSKPGDWRDWHRTVLRAVGQDIDWLAFHPYYCGLPIASMEGYLDTLRDDCRSIVPGHPIGIYVSEHARWPEQLKDQPWRTTWWMTHSLEGSLATGQFLARMLNRPEVTAAAYHCFSAGPWGLFYDHDVDTTRSSRVWRTGMADLLTAFGAVHGGTVVATTLAGTRTSAQDTDATCAVAAVRQGKELLLVLVNREATAARPLALSFRGRWRLAGGSLLNGADLSARNTPGTTAIGISAVPAAAGPLTAWTLPAHSLAVLRLNEVP